MQLFGTRRFPSAALLDIDATAKPKRGTVNVGVIPPRLESFDLQTSTFIDATLFPNRSGLDGAVWWCAPAIRNQRWVRALGGREGLGEAGKGTPGGFGVVPDFFTGEYDAVAVCIFEVFRIFV